MFSETVCFSSRVYMRMFPTGTISPGTVCKVSIISSRQSGTGVYMIKIVPLERTRILLCREGMKNGQAKFFPYKRNGTSKRDIYTCMARSRLTSRQTSHPTSHINSPLDRVVYLPFTSKSGSFASSTQSVNR